MGLLRNLFLNINAFENRQFFRFDKEAKYTNVLGGFCTIIILICVMTLLATELISVFSYTNVYAT
jgi:hypothetical protein